MSNNDKKSAIDPILGPLPAVELSPLTLQGLTNDLNKRARLRVSNGQKTTSPKDMLDETTDAALKVLITRSKAVYDQAQEYIKVAAEDPHVLGMANGMILAINMINGSSPEGKTLGTPEKGFTHFDSMSVMVNPDPSCGRLCIIIDGGAKAELLQMDKAQDQAIVRLLKDNKLAVLKCDEIKPAKK